MSSSLTNHTQLFDVIVIGAGLAGLSAARKLKRAGASVAVLEARNRIGGRVHSQRLNGNLTIDLGAQFIGDSQPRISALVDEVGLSRTAPYQRGDTVFVTKPGDNPVRKPDGQVPLSLLGKLDAFIAMWRLNRRLTSFREDVARLDSESAAQFVRRMTVLENPAAFLSGYAEGEMCAALADLSAYELLDQLASTGGFDGERGSAQWYLAEGTEPIAHHLAAELGDALVLNSPVTEIEQSDSSVTAFVTNRRYRGRYLIVAVPPQLYGAIGVLSHLPGTRRAAFAGYQHGRVIKTILVFEQPWWRDLGLSGRMSSLGSPFNAAIATSPADASAGVLVLFSTASSALKLCEFTEEASRIANAVEWLSKLCGEPIPNPIAARSIDWNSDPWSRGGYASRRGIGAWSAVPDLFAPAGRVHFAGTETATQWRSFMEGALQSAERAADAILGELA